MKFILLLVVLAMCPTISHAEPSHGIAMHGQLKHGESYRNFSYVSPDAPKGGRLTIAATGSYDSLNPLIVKGVAAAGLRAYLYESLMARAYDEPFSLYGLIAQSVETPDDRSSVTFYLNPDAKFSDGKPVTVDDVIYSHQILRDKGRPNHRFYYSKVEKVEKVGQRGIKFTFKPDGDREMPLIMGLMPILPSHSLTPDNFEKTSLDIPVGSGPYTIGKIDAGKSIVYKRNSEYWGRDLPAMRGRYNFDEIRFDYYRDDNTMFEAFKKGLYDIRSESDPGRWALGYDFPAVNDGRIVKEEFDIAIPAGMFAYAFNTRRPIFADHKVREALTLLFDFEWTNKNLFHGLYRRTQSFFERSELSSHGKPADDLERRLLAPFPGSVKPEIMDGTYKLPVSDGSGRNRNSRRKALKLFEQAGYVLKGAKLVDKKTNKPFTFEILSASRSQERLLLNFSQSLRRAGIDASIRQVDSSQYQRRKQTYDFDMIQNNWITSLSPGNEQNFRWNSKSADMEGTFNYPGIKNPAVDAMIQAVLSAKDRMSFVSSVRALDRVLLSGNYVIPLFHLPKQWIAHWSRLHHPDRPSLYGFQVDSWWVDKKK